MRVSHPSSSLRRSHRRDIDSYGLFCVRTADAINLYIYKYWVVWLKALSQGSGTSVESPCILYLCLILVIRERCKTVSTASIHDRRSQTKSCGIGRTREITQIRAVRVSWSCTRWNSTWATSHGMMAINSSWSPSSSGRVAWGNVFSSFLDVASAARTLWMSGHRSSRRPSCRRAIPWHLLYKAALERRIQELKGVLTSLSQVAEHVEKAWVIVKEPKARLPGKYLPVDFVVSDIHPHCSGRSSSALSDVKFSYTRAYTRCYSQPLLRVHIHARVHILRGMVSKLMPRPGTYLTSLILSNESP